MGHCLGGRLAVNNVRVISTNDSRINAMNNANNCLQLLAGLILVGCLGLAGACAGDLRQIDGVDVELELMAHDIATPWGLAFLPACQFLVTERDGALIRVDAAGNQSRVGGVPDIWAQGQGGLLDIEAARDFPMSRDIFLTYSALNRERLPALFLAVAELSSDGNQLTNLRILFEGDGSSGGRHFGARVIETPDGMIYLTLGDRGAPMTAQDLSISNGKILRLRRDGSIPDDNPFVENPSALREIWSYGHRNPQGAAIDVDAVLWTAEHGPRGGDEVNQIRRGQNYGWPVISYGVHYSGRKVGEGVAKAGMEQPEFYWDPSIAPAGMTVYSGQLWPHWQGQLFVGSLKFDYISRLSRDPAMQEVERISFAETLRVRDVEEAPDGTIWFTSEGRSAVYRIFPPGWKAQSEWPCVTQ